MQQAKQENSHQTDSKPGNFINAHGRRKTATARVRLFNKPGGISVNDLPIEQYFPGELEKETYLKPLVLTNTQNKIHATIKVSGSGKSSQLGAVVHGLARALVETNPDFRPILRREGLLTRDPRAKERRKYGLAQKARKGKQSPRR